ncbi:endocuticle structural glycoprotein SgAbd-3-like [Thrips palmi]|uniref:Endocuticle structural glycoprotein SgAbd-3-like n=1 Tax=Thrips palmi TaxID=161013 RepID=A0A6P8YH73_THRPL|nr:endocuticle structural glycoprotein SgAbd-3-like [Thrips palmi]
MIVKVAAILALAVALEALPAVPGRAGGRAGDRAVGATKYSNRPNSGDGSYRYEFELPDGSLRYEEGALQNVGMPGKEFLQVRGVFSRPSFDGKSMEQVMYIADEAGFRIEKAPQLGQAPSAGLLASLVG